MKRYRGREPEKLSRLSECSRQHVLGEVESGMGRTGGEKGGRGDDLAPQLEVTRSPVQLDVTAGKRVDLICMDRTTYRGPITEMDWRYLGRHHALSCVRFRSRGLVGITRNLLLRITRKAAQYG